MAVRHTAYWWCGILEGEDQLLKSGQLQVDTDAVKIRRNKVSRCVHAGINTEADSKCVYISRHTGLN